MTTQNFLDSSYTNTHYILVLYSMYCILIVVVNVIYNDFIMQLPINLNNMGAKMFFQKRNSYVLLLLFLCALFYWAMLYYYYYYFYILSIKLPIIWFICLIYKMTENVHQIFPFVKLEPESIW